MITDDFLRYAHRIVRDHEMGRLPAGSGAACGYQLVAAQRDNNPGSGHHYQSPYRLRCIALLRAPFGAAFGRALLAQRGAIERAFGNATAFAGGLGPLPAWVRRCLSTRQRRARASG